MKREQEHHSYIWFKFRGSVFGGLYLPPNIELATCIECVLSAADLMAGSGNEDPMFLVGDLNMRLGRLTGDLIANLRSTLDTRSVIWSYHGSDPTLVNGRSRCRVDGR